MPLTEKHKIAARLLAAGLYVTEVARRLEITPDAVHKMLHRRAFRDEVDFWRKKGVEIFEERMRRLMGIIGDRLTQIILYGKDADSLNAMEKALRALGLDKQITQDPSRENALEELATLLSNATITAGFGIRIGSAGGNGSQGQAPTPERKLIPVYRFRRLAEDDGDGHRRIQSAESFEADDDVDLNDTEGGEVSDESS